MPAVLTRTEDALELEIGTLKGAAFQDALAKIKSVPGAKFDWDRKVWLAPPEPDAAERILHSIQPNADPEISEWIKQARTSQAQELVTPLPEDAKLLIPWATQRCPWQPETVNGQPFNGLMRHQRPAVDLLADQCRALLADEMGIGKTIQAISAVAEHCERTETAMREYPKLVVSPNSVKGTWARELERWLGTAEPYQIIDATTPKARHNQLVRSIEGNEWVIVNYEQLRTYKDKVRLKNGGIKTIEKMKEPLLAFPELHPIDPDELARYNFQKLERLSRQSSNPSWLAAIADEIHRAKNRKAKQARGLWHVQAPIMFGLTGTPIQNSPDELWSILHWLWPKEYTAYWRFYEMYVDYYEGHFGKVITGVKNPDALRFELVGRLVRRTKSEVLDLPGKVRITVPVTLGVEQRKLYERAETEVWLEVEKALEAGDASAARLAQAAAAGQSATTLYRLPNGAARTVRLRQVLSTPALLGGNDDSAKLDYVQDRILDNAHKQHIVYSEFVDTCSILADRLRKHGLRVDTYTGKVDQSRRTELEDEFQRGEIDVLIGTIEAMNTGITLTAGDTQHWLERHWNPKQNEQGEDRQDRIGQDTKVTIYIYEAQDTVDDGKVAPTNRLKERIAQAVLTHDPIEEVVENQ